MVNILDESRKTSRVWWRVYLDNFAAGQVLKDIDEARVGAELHALAELAWKQAGVLSSDKKRRALETQVEELGAFVDGQSGYLGGSPEKFIKLIQATLWVLTQPLLSKKLVQVVAGRWIHVMQLRQATMPLLEKTWAFASHKRLDQGIQTQVRRELFSCLCSIQLMRADIKAKVNDVITASDASSTECRVGAELHALAELAWKQAGVLSSDKKRRALETQVEELGAFVDGPSGYLGGSPERFVKLIQATLWVLTQPLLSKKLVQVVAGRWIHVMQLRRATMPLLEKTWAFASHKRLDQGIQTQVRRELFSCLCSIPLMRTDIKAKVNDVITASDASSTECRSG
eukprot:Skav215398  [mRNA]  locus=scaffold3390:148908:150442:- [translate_table: standard]